MVDPVSSNLPRAGEFSHIPSFDDAETFQMKIGYARKMSLHALIIGDIDLNTQNLEALEAIPKRELIGHTQAPFSLMGLERVFPAEILPRGCFWVMEGGIKSTIVEMPDNVG
ncbi:Chitinase [Fusarium keratoplasticum]|nr:Chitinase [Fusarium keratoplasticum]